MPDHAAAPPAQADLAALAAAFGERLHAAGVPVTPERMARFAEAVLLASPHTTREAYWLGRVTLLTGQFQIPVYDRIFDEYFRGYVDLIEGGTPPQDQPASPLARSCETRA